MTSAIVNQMGREKPGADFSGDRFKTAWDAMPDNTKRLMFNSTGKPELAKSVEDIMRLSEAHKRLTKYGNPSGTSRAASLHGGLLGLWVDPLSTLGAAVSGNILARIMASPIAAKQAKNWTSAYVNAARSGSKAHLSLLGTASGNLANTINKQFGTAFTGADLLRLEGPGAGRADQGDIPGPERHQANGGKVGNRQGFAHGGAVENGKATHAQVQYVPKSKKPGERCATCTMFIPKGKQPAGCTDVRKPIWPQGWCVLFERKDA